MTVREATTILVLQDGRVIERGTHGDLLARDGTYAALYRLGQDRGAAITVSETDLGPRRTVVRETSGGSLPGRHAAGAS
jgi:hypothetical protein